MIKLDETLFPEIIKTIHNLRPETISDARKKILQPFIDFVQLKLNKKQEIRLNFICTHNSRRSHLSQIWAQTMAQYFNIKNMYCYSAGTEETALFAMVAETLIKSGFKIHSISEGNNPVYVIKMGQNTHPIIGFSKTIESPFNPKTNYAAILTCNSANEACPIIMGAEKRIPITFNDPKIFDNTPQQAEKYYERSLQIATEWRYVFREVKTQFE